LPAFSFILDLSSSLFPLLPAIQHTILDVWRRRRLTQRLVLDVRQPRRARSSADPLANPSPPPGFTVPAIAGRAVPIDTGLDHFHLQQLMPAPPASSA